MRLGTKLVNHIAFVGLNALGVKSLDPQPLLNNVYTFDGFDEDGWLLLKEFNVQTKNMINGERCSYNPKKFIPLDEYLDSISIEAEIKECLTKEFELV